MLWFQRIGTQVHSLCHFYPHSEKLATFIYRLLASISQMQGTNFVPFFFSPCPWKIEFISVFYSSLQHFPCYVTETRSLRGNALLLKNKKRMSLAEKS